MADVVAFARIFEEVPIPRSERTRRVLRFAPGQVIPEADAKRLNVKADGTQSKVPVADADDAGVIPLTQTVKKAAPAKKAAAKKTSRAAKAAKKRG